MLQDPCSPTSVLPAVLALLLAAAPAAIHDTKDQIAELEAKVAAKHGEFEYGLHNELRHLYSFIDEAKSLAQCDIILKHRVMDGYTLGCVGGQEASPKVAARALERVATKYPRLEYLAAAARLRAAELLISEPTQARLFAERVAQSNQDHLEAYRLRARALLEVLSRKSSSAPWKIPVLVLRYFPVTADGLEIDTKVTSNVGGSLVALQKKCDDQTAQVVDALEQGSRFRPYGNASAKPSLDYEVIDTITFLEPVPKDGSKAERADYQEILRRVDARHYVEERGVREIWIWGYHSKEIAPVESNMASPFGDVSNSDRDPNDLPLFTHTYTVYHYNYEREADMAVHDHLHQIEAVMREHGGELWKTFEGEPGKLRCGNCHFPVNGRRDYDYENTEPVLSDIEDWRPEGFGKKKRISCERWNADDLQWYVYWMQAIPGAKNGLTYQDRRLSNWWQLIGDYDAAFLREKKLVD